MPASIQSIIKEISYYLRSNGSDCKDWFVGLSHDPLETIITKHSVDEEKDSWIYRECLSHKDALDVLKYFREILKCDGSKVLETQDEAKYVYAYKKNDRTEP